MNSSGIPRQVTIALGGRADQLAHLGPRLASAFRSLGSIATTATWQQLPTLPPADLLVVAGLEHLPDEARSALGSYGGKCQIRAATSEHLASSESFLRLARQATDLGITQLWDVAFADQGQAVPTEYRSLYRFLPEGLTELEAEESLKRSPPTARQSWAVVGKASPHDALLAEDLARILGTPGIVRLQEADEPDEDLKPLLEKVDFRVWRSLDPWGYLEPRPVRECLLAGTIPVAIIDEFTLLPLEGPFRRHRMPLGEVSYRLTTGMTARIWRVFAEEYATLPRLEKSLRSLLLQG